MSLHTVLGSPWFNNPSGWYLSDVYSPKNTPLVGKKDIISHFCQQWCFIHHVLNLPLKCIFYVWREVYGTIKHSFRKPIFQNDHFYIIKWSITEKKTTSTAKNVIAHLKNIKVHSKNLENKSTFFLQAKAIAVKTFSSLVMPVTKHLFAGSCHCGAAGKLWKYQT